MLTCFIWCTQWPHTLLCYCIHIEHIVHACSLQHVTLYPIFHRSVAYSYQISLVALLKDHAQHCCYFDLIHFIFTHTFYHHSYILSSLRHFIITQTFYHHSDILSSLMGSMSEAIMIMSHLGLEWSTWKTALKITIRRKQWGEGGWIVDQERERERERDKLREIWERETYFKAR